MAFVLLAMVILSGIFSLVSLVCFILILIKMFATDDAVLAIVCIVTFFCGGIGYLIAFVMGWIKSSSYDAETLMLVWSGSIGGGLLLSFLARYVLA